MKKKKLYPIFEDFGKALKRFREVLNLKKTDIVRDSAIKRFELCFDLSWKSIKIFVAMEGLECYSPRSCFKFGFQLGLFKYNEVWMEMVEARNLSVHLYAEKSADELYKDLPKFLKLFEELHDNLKVKLKT